jgi:hypothetical protein
LLARAFGAGPLVALKIVYFAFLLVASLGCYRLVRLHAGEETAAFGTLLFLTSNFVIGEVFHRSAYAEFLSVALLPYLMVALHRALVTGGLRPGTMLACLAALMILFHPLSFMNAGWALLAYAVFTVLGCGIPMSRLLRLAAPLALAFGLTAFYWLPAVVETRHVLGAAGVPTPVQETFLSVKRYLNFSGIRSLGLVLTLLTPIMLVRLFTARRGPAGPRRPLSWPLVAAIFVYLFLTLPVSQPLYDNIRLLASNLWVWRVLYPMTLLCVLLVTVNIDCLPTVLRKPVTLRVLALLAILQAVAMVLWNTAGELSLRRVPVQEIARTVAEQGQRTEGWGIDEYLPNPASAPPQLAGCRDIRRVVPTGSNDLEFVIEPGDDDVCIHVPRYWNVRYAAWVDGQAVPVGANSDGEIIIAPAGSSGLLELRFTRPRYVATSAVLSILSCGLLVGLIATAATVRITRQA